MPVNKSALFRFEIIDECLRNDKKRWSKNDLLNHLNKRLELRNGDGCIISISQLRHDLEHMQSALNAPIEMYRDGRSCFYRYNDLSFSIKNIPIQDEDFIKLHSAVSILSQMKGFTIAEQIAEIVQKIEHRYQFNNVKTNPSLLFDHTPYIAGIDYLEDLYLSIQQRTVLKIMYQSFRMTFPQEVIVHPYLLKEYKHRWYMLGYNNTTKKIGTFAIERIKSIKVTNNKFIENTLLDCEEYFSNIIGVTKPKGATAQNIHLQFSPTIAPYILSQPLHASQEVIKKTTDGYTHVHLNLIINHELVSLLLSFGQELRVVLPEILSLQLQGAALMLLNNYTSK